MNFVIRIVSHAYILTATGCDSARRKSEGEIYRESEIKMYRESERKRDKQHFPEKRTNLFPRIVYYISAIFKKNKPFSENSELYLCDI